MLMIVATSNASIRNNLLICLFLKVRLDKKDGPALGGFHPPNAGLLTYGLADIASVVTVASAITYFHANAFTTCSGC